MGKKYKSSPLIEVLCEVQFEPDAPWDLAIPGIIYDKVKEHFPVRRQTTRFTLGPPSQGDVNPELSSTQLTQFWSSNEQSLIQIGPYLLSINHLVPYPSWQKFLPVIQENVAIYRDVANPSSIHSISLRYINRITFSDEHIHLEDFFAFRPFIGPDLPQIHGPFVVAMQIPYEHGRDILTLQLTSVAGVSQSDIFTVNLDLTYSLIKPGDIALDTIATWLEAAHERIEYVFEASIMDKLKQKFEEVQE